MFNRTVVVHPMERRPEKTEITVTERRAPTDDSVRLYKEIREQVIQELLEAYRTEDNTVNIAWIVLQDRLSLSRTVRGLLTLNGKDYKLEFPMDDLRGYAAGHLELSEFVRRGVADSLSRVLTIELFRQAPEILAVRRG